MTSRSTRFKPLSQAQALALRGDRLRNVVLDDVLAESLMRINRFTHRGREYDFDLADAHEAMRRLKPTPDRLKGLKGTNPRISTTYWCWARPSPKPSTATAKASPFRFIDWEVPENNSFHVTAEFAVERVGSAQTKRCDIVALHQRHSRAGDRAQQPTGWNSQGRIHNLLPS